MSWTNGCYCQADRVTFNAIKKSERAAKRARAVRLALHTHPPPLNKEPTMKDQDQFSEEEIHEAAAEEPTGIPQHMPTHLPSGFDGVEPGKDRTLPAWLSVGPFPIRLRNGKTMFIAKVKLGDVRFEVEGSRNRAEGHWDVFLFEDGKEIGVSKFTVNYDCVLRIAVGMMRHYITRKFGRYAGAHGHVKFLERAIARSQEVN